MSCEHCAHCRLEEFQKLDWERTADSVIDQICAIYRVTHEEIRGNTQVRRVTWPRQIAYYLIRKMTCASFPKIAGYFHKKEHTSVLTGVAKVSEYLASHPETARTVAKLSLRVTKREEERLAA